MSSRAGGGRRSGPGRLGLCFVHQGAGGRAGPVATGRPTKRERGKGQIHGRNGGFLWILDGFVWILCDFMVIEG